jgi:hypothetical protein
MLRLSAMFTASDLDKNTKPGPALQQKEQRLHENFSPFL